MHTDDHDAILACLEASSSYKPDLCSRDTFRIRTCTKECTLIFIWRDELVPEPLAGTGHDTDVWTAIEHHNSMPAQGDDVSPVAVNGPKVKMRTIPHTWLDGREGVGFVCTVVWPHPPLATGSPARAADGEWLHVGPERE